MNMMMRSSAGITLVTPETRLFDKREIFITGEITDEVMCDFFQKMRVLIAEDADAPISIFINSPGGEIRSGLAMYNMIASCKTEINIYVLAKAFSMAAVLLVAGKKGHRFLMPYSEVMIHEPLITSRVGGSTSSIRSISESLQESKELIDGILVKHTGHSMEEVCKATGFDHYFKAEEAVEWGLADKIVEFCDM